MNTAIKRVITLTFFVIALTLFTMLGISAETVDEAIAANKVAYIGTAEEVASSYDTFSDALAAVQNGETIYVINSFTSSSLYEVAASRNFRIEGVKNEDANPVITHSGSAFLKINSGAVITVKNLDITFSTSGAYKCIETIKSSNFTLDGCTLTVTSTASAHIIDTNGTALIQNCTLIYKSGGSKLLNVGSGNCTIDTCIIELDPADDPNADTNKITTDILRNYAPLNIVNTTITDGGTGNNLFYPANASGVTIVSGSTVTTSRNSYVVGSLSFINGSVCSTTGSNIYFDLSSAAASDYIAYIGEAPDATIAYPVATYYKTLASAISAVPDGETIYVINDFDNVDAAHTIAKTRSFSIVGAKADGTTPLITSAASPILDIRGTIALENLSIKCTAGRAAYIYDSGSLSLNNVTVTADGSSGSVLINSAGKLIISNSTINVDAWAGDIIRSNGTAILTNVTVTDNATTSGKYTLNVQSQTTYISNSTITGRAPSVAGTLYLLNGTTFDKANGETVFFDASSAVANSYVARIGGSSAKVTLPGATEEIDVVSGTFYKSLYDAMVNGATGSTIILFADTDTPKPIWGFTKTFTIKGEGATAPKITSNGKAYMVENKGSLTFENVDIELTNAALAYISTNGSITLGKGVNLTYTDTASVAEGLVFLTGTGASFTVKDGATITIVNASAIANNNGLLHINSTSTNASITFEGFVFNVTNSARRMFRCDSATGSMSFADGTMNVTKVSTHYFRHDAGSLSLDNVAITFGADLKNVDLLRIAAKATLQDCTITDNGTGSNLIYTTGTGTTYVSDCDITSARSFSTDAGGFLYVLNGSTMPTNATGVNIYYDAASLAASGFVARVGNTSTEVTLPGGEQPVTVYLSTDYHKSLTTAVSALTSGGTVYVIANITEQARGITVAEGLTIILEGGSKTVTVADSSSYLFTVAGTLTVQNVTFTCNGNFATASGTLTVGDNTVVEGIYGSTAGGSTDSDHLVKMTGSTLVTINRTARLTNNPGTAGYYRTSLINSTSDWSGTLNIAGTLENKTNHTWNRFLVHTNTNDSATPKIVLQSGAHLFVDMTTALSWCAFFRSDTTIQTEAGATNILVEATGGDHQISFRRSPGVNTLYHTLYGVTFAVESNFRLADQDYNTKMVVLQNVSFVSDTFANSLALQIFRINQNKNTLQGYTDYYTGYYSGYDNTLNVADNGDTVYVLVASLTTTGYTTGTNKTFTLEGVLIGGSHPVITHSSSAFMNVAAGSNVTVKNLTINATGKIGYATGSLTFENVTLTFTGNVYGFVTANATSGMTLRNCSLTVNEHSADNVFRGAGVHVIDGGSVTLNNTAASNVKYFSTGSGSMEIKGGAQITVTAWNGDLFSTSGTLHFNGATVNDGTANNTFVYAGTGNIILTDSGISTNRLIQLDANATMTVNGGSLTKADSSTTKKFIVNYGTVNILDGTITVNAGASEAITSHGTLNISGGKLIAHNLSYSFIYIPASGTLNITGGYFEDDGNGTLFNLVSMDLTMANATIHVKGGSDLFPDGTVVTLRNCAIYMASESPDFPANPDLVTLLGVKIAGVNSDTTATAIGASFRLGAEATSVSFGDTNVDCNVYYSYFEDALAAVTDSEATIYLVNDGARLYRVAGGITIPAGKTITLDGERRYAIVNGANTHTLFVIEQGGTLTLQQISLTSCPTRLADVQGTLTLGDGAHVIASASTGTVQETSPVITLGGSAIVTINEGASIVLDYADNDAHKVDSASAYVFMTEDDWTGTLTINGTVTHGWSVVGYSAIFYLQSNAGSISVGQNATVTQTGKAADGNAMIMSLNSADTRFTITEGATFTSVFPLRSGDVNATDSYTKRVLGYASISIDIYWGELVFVFTEGEWNTETHVYDDGEWTVEAQGGANIRIVNVGTLDVTATLSFTAADGFEDVSGSFTESNSATVSAGAEKTFTLSLEGQPEKFEDGTRIGRVTVTISDAQGGN